MGRSKDPISLTGPKTGRTLCLSHSLAQSIMSVK